MPNEIIRKFLRFAVDCSNRSVPSAFEIERGIQIRRQRELADCMLWLMGAEQCEWAIVMHQEASPNGLRLQQSHRCFLRTASTARAAIAGIGKPGLRWAFCVFLISTFLFPLALPIDLSSIQNKSSVCTCDSHCTCRYCRTHHRGVTRSDDSTVLVSPDNTCPCSPDRPANLVTGMYILVRAQTSGFEVATKHVTAHLQRPQPKNIYIRLRQKRGPPYNLIAA
jgi:hypothetical protein